MRAAGIVSRMRHLVRKGASRREIFDLGTAIEQTLMLVDHERRRRGVHIEVRREPELPPVDADRVQVEQILLNLLHPDPRRAGAARDGGGGGLGGRRRARMRVLTGQAVPLERFRTVRPRSRSPIRSRNGISIAQATATFTP